MGEDKGGWGGLVRELVGRTLVGRNSGGRLVADKCLMYYRGETGETGESRLPRGIVLSLYGISFLLSLSSQVNITFCTGITCLSERI